MKKPLLPVILSLSLIGVVALRAEAIQETVKVGVNLSLSGASSSVETSIGIRDAMILAKNELNERTDPVAPYHYELFFEDNQWTPRGANLAANKLLRIALSDTFID